MASFISCKRCSKKIRANITGYCRECLYMVREEETITHWKETGNTGCAVATTLRNAVRRYLEVKQNNCCAICGIEAFWNGRPISLVLDHIDGDASNNWENNLRLVCPNCDSQLPTFKSRNKNSARAHRRE